MPRKRRARYAPRLRVSEPAQADIAHILSISEQSWGTEGRVRYATVLAAAMRKISADPEGPGTRDRSELKPGVRSFPIRHVRTEQKNRVKRPVHVLFYRRVEPGLIEIVRVLHERMEPSSHLPKDDD